MKLLFEDNKGVKHKRDFDPGKLIPASGDEVLFEGDDGKVMTARVQHRRVVYNRYGTIDSVTLVTTELKEAKNPPNISKEISRAC